MTLQPWTEAQWVAAERVLTGKRLHQLRTKRGLTLAQVGDAVGVKRNTVSRWEHGEREIPRMAVRHLFELFDLPAPEP